MIKYVRLCCLVALVHLSDTLQAEQLNLESAIPEVVYGGLLYLDYQQTKKIYHSAGAYSEVNPVLRQNRLWNRNGIRNYFLVGAAAHVAASKALSPFWRKRFQVGTIALQAGVVFNNLQIGLEF